MSEPAAPKVKERFRQKVEALEILAGTPGSNRRGLPLTPTSLRAWSGKVTVGSREIELFRWSSPNEFYEDANIDLRTRFEKIVAILSTGAKVAPARNVEKTLAMQNTVLLLENKDLRDELVRTRHLLSLRDAEISEMKKRGRKLAVLVR